MIDETVIPIEDEEEVPIKRVCKKKVQKTIVEKIIELARDMVDDALAEAQDFALGRKTQLVSEGLACFNIQEAVKKMDENKQKEVLKKFKEILRG